MDSRSTIPMRFRVERSGLLLRKLNGVTVYTKYGKLRNLDEVTTIITIRKPYDLLYTHRMLIYFKFLNGNPDKLKYRG